MKMIADSNVLVRAAVRDNPRQARIAASVLKDAETIVVPIAAVCEFVAVLRRVYRFSGDDIRAALRALIAAGNVEINRPAVEAGMATMSAGGDFTDGVIAYEGKWMGGETFVSFDRQAFPVAAVLGQKPKLLS
ncbi:MAG TPA: type II toxin-antitoxin system VapC family toxin [Terracidiphilus sp.]|jgi:predicted nucleic-acid-binding protein